MWVIIILKNFHCKPSEPVYVTRVCVCLHHMSGVFCPVCVLCLKAECLCPGLSSHHYQDDTHLLRGTDLFLMQKHECTHVQCTQHAYIVHANCYSWMTVVCSVLNVRLSSACAMFSVLVWPVILVLQFLSLSVVFISCSIHRGRVPLHRHE